MKDIVVIDKNKCFKEGLKKILNLLNINYKFLIEDFSQYKTDFDYIILNNGDAINKNFILDSRYCFINMDKYFNNNIKINGGIITYGFGNKNTVTISSIQKENYGFVYCLQRYLNYEVFKVIEPKEFPAEVYFKNDDELYAYMVGITIALIEKLDKESIKKNLNIKENLLYK